MTEIANWIIDHGEKIGAYSILFGMVIAFAVGKLWTNNAVMFMRADYERRDAEKTKDCEYNRIALERVLGELERTISTNKILASKTL